MIVRLFATAAATALAVALAASAGAQTTTPRAPATPRSQTTPRMAIPPAPPAPPAAPGEPAPPVPPPPPPRRAGQPVNVKVDVTITDQSDSAAPASKKTVSVVTADGLGGRIRSVANYSALNTPLNVDVEPEILSDGKIRVRINLQYTLPRRGQEPEVTSAGTLRVTEIQENLSLVLENGKPLIAAQSADPVGDRQVTIEVRATVLRP